MNAPVGGTEPPARWRDLLARDEAGPLLAAAAAYFSLLAGWYMLRSVREALALQVGREHIDVLFYTTFAVMLLVLPAYWFVVRRAPRRRLLPVAYAFVVALLLSIALALASVPGSRAAAAVYFVTVTSLNLFMVSVFWSVMVDAWRSAEAKRLFGFIAGGGSAGAIAGPAFNALFVEQLGTPAVIAIAAALVAAAAACGARAQSLALGAHGGPAGARLEVAVGGRALDDLRRLLTSPYLLAIAALIVAGQVLGGLMYNEQARYVESAYATLADRVELFARIDLAVNVLSLLLQVGVVGWLAARGGLRLALGFVPLLLAGSLALLALVPVGAMLLATQVFRRAVDYGLFKPTREMLFTVLNPESKFKSKSLIDTLLQRGGDSAGQLLYGAVAGLGLAGIAWVCAALSLAMLGVAAWLGGSFGRAEASGTVPQRSAAGQAPAAASGP
jgi:AAA family ATP:ADP antiporter